MDLYRDGTRITTFAANTGTVPVGRFEVGDTAAKTWTINFDDVVVDQVAGTDRLTCGDFESFSCHSVDCTSLPA